jgi:RHS repeat-associated protein
MTQTQKMSKKLSLRPLFLRKNPVFGRKTVKIFGAVAIHGENFCQKKFTVKELDAETGLYYYGARYLDPKTSRWLSGDPAIGEYIPSAPVNDEAKKRNGNLPGIGGVFNHVNLHAYHYSFNNPITYIDPDGRDGNSFLGRLENLANSVDQFISENKEALLVIAAGGTLIVAGNLLKGGGVAGGVALSGGTGGLGTPAGVALAVAGVSAGGVMEAAGAGMLLAGLAMLASNNSNETGGGRNENNNGRQDNKPELITNPKHHPNSSSPQPRNVNELYKNSVEANNGTRWARDSDGTLHRFNSPSNGQTHWNGSTAGTDPIRPNVIPPEIKRFYGITD